MNPKSKTLPLRLSDSLVELADMCSQEQRTDRSTVLRQCLYHSAEAYALKKVATGRLSVGRAAELLELSIYDIYEKAQDAGIEIGSTPEQFRECFQYAGFLEPKVKE